MSLGGNELSDLKPLAALKDLLTLDVQGNKLTEALDFGGATSNNLQRAILSNNKVCSRPRATTPIRRDDGSTPKNNPLCPALTRFPAQISRLDAIVPHIHLSTLMLADNEISSLACLSELKQLRYLDVSGNQLEDVEGLCGQPIQVTRC